MIIRNVVKRAPLILAVTLMVSLQGGIIAKDDAQSTKTGEHEGNMDLDRYFSKLQDRMNEIIGNIFSNSPRREPLLPGASAFASPLLNMSENDKGVEIKVELPGLNDSDIKIESKNNQLIIKGERKEEKDEKDKNYYIHESFGGNFLRVVTIPFEFDVSKAKAIFKNGILDIFIEKPKEPAAALKTIPITPQ